MRRLIGASAGCDGGRARCPARDLADAARRAGGVHGHQRRRSIRERYIGRTLTPKRGRAASNSGFTQEAGYDVWLGNHRAYFNSEHKTLKPSDPKFWNYNLRDMAMQDIPTMVGFVCKQTGHNKVSALQMIANQRLAW